MLGIRSISSKQKRLWIIPACLGLVWIASFLVSLCYNSPSILNPNHILFRIFTGFNLVLLFELLLMAWDIKLLLDDFELHRDHSFRIQCLTVPFLILGLPFSIIAFEGGPSLIFCGIILFCAKVGMHHSSVFADHVKVHLGYNPPEEYKESRFWKIIAGTETLY